MRSYEDRLDHIRTKVKTTKMAYTAIGLSVTTLCVLALVVCGLFVWPGLLFDGVLSEPQPTERFFCSNRFYTTDLARMTSGACASENTLYQCFIGKETHHVTL